MSMFGKDKRKLSNQIIGLILGITLFVSVISSIALYRYFSGVMFRQIRADNQVKFDKIREEFDAVFDEAVKYGQQVSVNQSVQRYMSMDSYGSVVEEYKATNAILKEMQHLTLLSQYIDSFALEKEGEVRLWSRIPFWDGQSRVLYQEWYGTFLEAAVYQDGQEGKISQPYDFTYAWQTEGMQAEFISIYMPVYSYMQRNTLMGGLIINIEMKTLDQLLRENSNGFECVGYFSNGRESLYPSDSPISTEEMLNATSGEAVDGQHTPLFFCGDTALHIHLVAALNPPGLLDASWTDLAVLLLLFLVGMTVLAAGLIPVMLRVTKPVAVLADAMQRVGEGDLDVHVQIHTRDEFETLGHELNWMVRRLDSFIQESIRHEKECHELEFEVLMAQINPHFIYNTLNTIVYLGRKERHKDVVIITKALISLLQDGLKLSENKNFATVQEEIWIIQNYILIQNYRYKDQFVMDIACPEELLRQRIPTSVIQPLVENALFHGIVPLGHPGNIWLEIKQCERNDTAFICVRVSDDGAGVSEDKIRAIMSGELKLSDTSRNHVGVRNIWNRLSLLYDGNFTMDMSPRETGGTQVEVWFPIEVDGQNRDL